MYYYRIDHWKARLVILVLILSYVCAFSSTCKTPQYLEDGSVGTIACPLNKENEYASIHWYFNSDATEGHPTVSFEDNESKGLGYDSGEFEVSPDGSLIIRNVTVAHEARFTVYGSTVDQSERPIGHDIQIFVFIRPKPPYPIVDECQNISQTCYFPWTEQSWITCRIQQAKPGVELTWIARNKNGDKIITNNTRFTNQTNTWTSSLPLDNPFKYPSALVLLVCKANQHFDFLEKNETIMVVHNNSGLIHENASADVACKPEGMIEFTCGGCESQLLVWDRVYSNGSSSVIGFSGDGVPDTVVVETYMLEGKNLSIPDVTLYHEGLYRCTSSCDGRNDVNVFNLTVYVNPVPEYLIIEGCSHKQYCVLGIFSAGSLSCSVRGIRPEVNLEWRTYREESREMISFHNQRVKSVYNGRTYDITLTTKYTTKETQGGRITAECRVTGQNAKYFRLSSQLELLFPGAHNKTVSNDEDANANTIRSPSSTPVIFVCIGLIFFVVIVLAVLGWRRCATYVPRTNEQQATVPNDSERIPMIPKGDSVFVSQLKSSYENLYSSIQPIPFMKEKLTVNELYVESGIEYLSHNRTKETHWERLYSYHNIFTNKNLCSDRWIIEGEAGYGKSTLCLQLVYEWSKKVKTSCMSTVDILIFVRLRQLEGIVSIYQAIKTFLLPKDTTITVYDIKESILNSSSVLIILDGFDEYPGKESERTDSDVFDILNRKMLSNCKVVLTTRSSQLPKEFPAQTNRVRLTGFNTEAQKKYLQKNYIDSSSESQRNTIQTWLEDNPILKDLCEVPLFFAMYVHLSSNHDALSNCTSVTGFFRYVITSLHHHLKLKFKDDNAANWDSNEDNHMILDELCFEWLNGHGNNPNIEKETLLKKLGQEFFNQYLRIGIFREEEITLLSNLPDVPDSRHVTVVSKFRFYHSLFCEWYAAHHLAEKLSHLEEEEEPVILEDLDPLHFHYVFRFACGLNKKAAIHIFDYLKVTPVRESFSILCILEQRGNIDVIIENLKKICEKPLRIKDEDTRVIKRSVIQLMEIAASKEITIPMLELCDCFREVDHSRNEFVLSSEVRLSLPNNVTTLSINQKGTQFKQTELQHIFEHVSSSNSLHEIRFLYSLLPYQLKWKGKALKKLDSIKNVKVRWYPSKIWYCLDLKSGSWKHETGNSSHMKESEYKSAVKFFHDTKS